MTKYFRNAFATGGDREAVPDQAVGTLVNYEKGYTPEYELDPDVDPAGNYVGRRRMNQLFNDITGNLKFWQENGVPEIVANDGTGNPLSYKKGFVGSYLGVIYRALIDDTATLPPSAEWVAYDLQDELDKLLKVSDLATTAGTSETTAMTQKAVTEINATSLDFSNFSGFKKRLPQKTAWQAESATLATQQEIAVSLNGYNYKIPFEALVEMPVLVPGTDYAVYATEDGRLVADSNFSEPSSEPTGTTKRIGGFHVFLTGEIAQFSLWDENFRPTAPNPRGMVFEPLKQKWVDIYLLGQNHIVDGTSRANVNIASGSRLPKKPLIYGGDGAASYTRLSYFEARNIMASHGKFLPDLQLVASALNGSTPLIAIGSDPVTTKHAPGYRSNIGVEQSTGHLWIWTDEHSAWNTSGAWVDMGTDQGNWYGENFRTAIAAGGWSDAGGAGPGCVSWRDSPTYSYSSFSARGFSDHKGS